MISQGSGYDSNLIEIMPLIRAVNDGEPAEVVTIYDLEFNDYHSAQMILNQQSLR